MSDFMFKPKAEEAVVETPVVEEAPVVEAPVVEEVLAEPVKEEAPTEEVKPEEAKPVDAITAPRYSGRPEVQAVGPVNGAIGVTSVPVEEKPAPSKKKDSKKETVALRSTKNVTWAGVGKVYNGINIVDKDEADKWLTRSHVTLATPEEVAKEFGL